MRRLPTPDWTEEECQRKLEFWRQHPSGTPPGLGPEILCFSPPSFMRSTATWMTLRDRVARQDRAYKVQILRQIDLVLAWRETVPRDRRFWAEDEPELTQRR